MRLSLIASVVAVAALAPPAAAAPPTSDQRSWAQCVEEPTKACVFERARANVRATTERFARLRALADLARGEVEAGLRDEALRDAKDLYTLALETDHAEERHGQLATVAEVRAKAGDFTGAKSVLPSLDRGYYVALAVRSIATELVKRGKTAEAVALMRSNPVTKDDVNTIREFAWDVRDIVVARGDEAGVVALLTHAQAVEDAQPEGPFRFFAGVHHPFEFVPPLMIIAAAEARAGKIEAALSRVRAVKKPRERARVRASVAAILARAGNLDAALKIAHAVPDEMERGETLDQIYASSGWEGADILFSKVEPVAAEAARRTFHAAMASAAGFATESERDTAFALIADTSARAGLVADALRALDRVSSTPPKPMRPRVLFHTLVTVGEAQAKAGPRKDAVATFARAEAVALRERHAADFLTQLAQAQAQCGQIDEALAVVAAMARTKSSSSMTTNGKPVDMNRLFALHAIAKAMAKVGRVTDAMKLARETEYDGGGVERGIGVVAEGLAEAGKIDEALQAAKAQTNSGWRDSLLLDIIKARLAGGHIEDAKKLRRGIAGDYEQAQALLEIARAQLLQASLFGDDTHADGMAAVSEALKLTATMASPNLALNILIDAGRLL